MLKSQWSLHKGLRAAFLYCNVSVQYFNILSNILPIFLWLSRYQSDSPGYQCHSLSLLGEFPDVQAVGLLHLALPSKTINGNKTITGTEQLFIRLHVHLMFLGSIWGAVNRKVDDKNITPDREGHRKRKNSLYGCYFKKYREYPCKNFTLIIGW